MHHYIQFEIQDTGIGIPGHKISGIFEPFVQVSDDTARKYGGTGLGLAIVKKLTELMKGELDVQSEANIGTTIKVTIPFYKENRQASSSEYTKEENIVADKHVPSSNNQINILVAEDNLINQELVKAVLAFYNYNCIIAENGQQAIELLQENDFELILMDIMMPVLGGYEATEIIRKMTDKRKNSIPIIALTAIVTDSVTQKCQQIGFDAYLSKPFDPAELNQKIRDLVIK